MIQIRQYTWDELLRPFNDKTPISDEEFIALMAQTHQTLEELLNARHVSREMKDTPMSI